MLLSIENLHVFYGGVHALKGISMRVDTGQIATLIGANGAGKSTTLRSICGLVQPQEGSIIYEDRDLTRLKPYEIVQAGIAMVPEGRRVFSNLTVFENLLLGAYARRDREAVDEDMERVTALFPVLKDRMSQRAGTLSGGEQQMLAVGRALMSRPRLLLMDEPSLGLAPILVDELFDCIQSIHREGMSILLVEQNAGAALDIADYGYVLEVGELVLEGPSAKLIDDDNVRRAYLGISEVAD